MYLSDPLLPAVAMVALTAVVWVRLYSQRIREMHRRRIAPRDLATSRQAASVLQDVSAADNFRNLFEVPVLFYVFCLALYTTHRQVALVLAGSWLFVALRGPQRHSLHVQQCDASFLRLRDKHGAVICIMGVARNRAYCRDVVLCAMTMHSHSWRRRAHGAEHGNGGELPRLETVHTSSAF